MSRISAVARIAYDELYSDEQDARTVFARRTATCEGYANLFEALGRATDDPIVIVSGAAASPSGCRPHAWNAVLLDGRWRFIDLTWDGGSMEMGGAHPTWELPRGPFVKRVTHEYFLDSRAFALDHAPHSPAAWRGREVAQNLYPAIDHIIDPQCGALGCPR